MSLVFVKQKRVQSWILNVFLLLMNEQQRKGYVAVAVPWRTSHECWKNVESSHLS